MTSSPKEIMQGLLAASVAPKRLYSYGHTSVNGDSGCTRNELIMVATNVALEILSQPPVSNVGGPFLQVLYDHYHNKGIKEIVSTLAQHIEASGHLLLEGNTPAEIGVALVIRSYPISAGCFMDAIGILRGKIDMLVILQNKQISPPTGGIQ